VLYSFRAATLVLAAAGAVAATAPAARAQKIPAELTTKDYAVRVETVVPGGQLKDPWAIAFVDADTALITEKAGRLRWLRNGKLSDPIAGTPQVVDNGQGGLLDVSLDPEYAKEPWVYLGYSHKLDAGTGRNPPAMTRIVRGKVVDNRWTDQQVLFEARPEHYTNGVVHYGNRIVFDKENRLYFSIGERGQKEHAQDLSRPNGKVHRINRDGTIPADNPFVGRPDVYESIYSYGNRNAQGLALHPQTNQLWETEHGPRGGDELNLILPGRNYGWPVITYGINYDGSPITDKRSAPGMEPPARHWTPSPAFCGLDAYTGTQFPKWQNHLLLGALAGQELRRVQVDGDKVVDEEIILKGAGRIRDVQVSPDGSIYVALNGPHAIIRLTPR